MVSCNKKMIEMIQREFDTSIHRSDLKEPPQQNYHSASKDRRLDVEKEEVPEAEEIGDYYEWGKEYLVLKAEYCLYWR